MRLLSVVVVVCALAFIRADTLTENDPLGQRILQRAAAAADNSDDFVFAEIVENIHDKSPASLDMAAVELEAIISTSAKAQQQAMQAAAFFPGYPAANPGFYGGYSYAPGAGAPLAQSYLSNARYAAVPASSGSSGSSSSGPIANAAYSQFGAPYSAFPPIPPPMPTYLPPPPYIPLATPSGGGAGSGSA